MKKVLIISPFFPPVNAADMQRIRMSLPYFNQLGWDASVVKVKDELTDMNQDQLLLESIPENTKIYEVKAFSKKYTSKIGLGSVALRSMWFYLSLVNGILKKEKYDLIYFSTTQFPLCILGAYWKKKFNIPFVVDMQDPWYSTYYLDKPKSERPKKFWFSYYLNKFSEPIAMKHVDGLISVSAAYIKTLKTRYKETIKIPSSVITFGAFSLDFELVKKHKNEIKIQFQKTPHLINLVYVGRGGHDMKDAIRMLFSTFKNKLNEQNSIYKSLKFHFIGTSYAPNGKGEETIIPYAAEFDLLDFVEEKTERISFYESIATLLAADALIVPGSNDSQYTASKIYPYLMAKKPLLGIFHPESSAFQILKDCNAGWVANIKDENSIINIDTFFENIIKSNPIQPKLEESIFEKYTAFEMTKQQTLLFDLVIDGT